MAGGEKLKPIEEKEVFSCLIDYLQIQTRREVGGALNSKEVEINAEMRKEVNKMIAKDETLRYDLLKLGIIDGISDFDLAYREVEYFLKGESEINRTIGYFFGKRLINEREEERKRL